MSDQLYSAPNMYAAVARIYDELPTLLGDAWPQVQPKIDEHMQAVRQATSIDAMAAPAFQINLLLEGYPDAHKRYMDELRLQETTRQIIEDQLKAAGFDDETTLQLSSLAFIGIQWEADPATIPQNEEEVRSTRTMTMKSDLSDAKSVKFRNFDLDLTSFAELSAEFSLLGMDVIDAPRPLLLAASVMLTVHTLRKEMTVKLTQQEASVFWGIAKACAHKSPRWATKAEIVEHTNTERDKIGLDDLSEEQVQYSLTRLLEMKSIDRVKGQAETYEMIENLRMAD